MPDVPFTAIYPEGPTAAAAAAAAGGATPSVPPQELFRLPAANGSLSRVIEGDFRTLVVLNPLAAPIYVGFGAGTPDATHYDVAVPGQSLMTYPIGRLTALTATVVYPGAVPAGDVGQFAVVSVSADELGISVGPLNA